MSCRCRTDPDRVPLFATILCVSFPASSKNGAEIPCAVISAALKPEGADRPIASRARLMRRTRTRFRPVSAADVTHLHFRTRLARREHLSTFITVTVHPAVPNATEEVFPLGIRRTCRANRSEHIPAEGREQTGVKLAVGRQPRPVTVPAKRFRDRADQTNFAAT